jgi:hypothetical protein
MESHVDETTPGTRSVRDMDRKMRDTADPQHALKLTAVLMTVLVCWWLCWCVDNSTVLVCWWPCWWHCVNELMNWCVDNSYCVDVSVGACVDDIVLMCWWLCWWHCVAVSISLRLCWWHCVCVSWCVDECVDDCANVMMTLCWCWWLCWWLCCCINVNVLMFRRVDGLITLLYWWLVLMTLCWCVDLLMYW